MLSPLALVALAAVPFGKLGLGYVGDQAKLVARARDLLVPQEVLRARDDTTSCTLPVEWRRVWAELASADPRLVVPATAIATCGALLEVLMAKLRGNFIDLAVARSVQPLAPALVQIGLLQIGIWAASIVGSAMFSRARWNMAFRARQRLVRAQLRSDERFGRGRRSPGEIVGRCDRETWQLTDSATRGPHIFISGCLQAMLALGEMAKIDTQMTLLGVLTRTPLALALTAVAARRLGLLGVVRYDALGKLDARTTEALAQKSAVQLGGCVEGKVAGTKALGTQAQRVLEHTDDVDSVLRATCRLIDGLQQITIIAAGTSAIRAGRISLGQLEALRGLLSSWGSATERLMDEVGKLPQLRTALTTYFHLLDEPAGPAVADPVDFCTAANAPDLVVDGGSSRVVGVPSADGDVTRGSGSLVIRQATVSLPTSSKADAEDERDAAAVQAITQQLRNVSVSIRDGEHVAIVGQSGSGKSMLLALLMRAVLPSSGAVELDGIPLHAVPTATLRRRMCVVTQDVKLFDRSIADNIRFHRPMAACTEPAVRAAAQALGLTSSRVSYHLGWPRAAGSVGACCPAGSSSACCLHARSLPSQTFSSWMRPPRTWTQSQSAEHTRLSKEPFQAPRSSPSRID